MKGKKVSIGVRLAFRREGDWVNCYLASDETMEGATLLSSINASIVETHKDLWDQWKAVLVEALRRQVTEIVGQVPDMPEHRAPEHERAGRA